MEVEAVGLTEGVWVVFVYLGVLWLPGFAVAHLLGARGWTLWAAAPLATYGLAGVLGPAMSAVGVPWSSLTFGAIVVVLVAGALALMLVRRRHRGTAVALGSCWSLAANSGVVAVLGTAAVIGGAAIARAMPDLSAIPQDWDAVFHANGIRFIAETGNGGLYGMAQVNWFEGIQVFYPNAYHLLGVVVFQLTGVPVSAVLNAHTLLIPGLTALSLVAVIRRMGGRAVLAGATAVVVVGLSAMFDMLWRGPLLPYATGVALTPLVVVLVLDLLDSGSARAAARPGLLFAVGLAGLICLQPASLISAILFAAPALVQRWWTRPRELLRDLPTLLVAGGIAAALSALQLLAGLGSAGDLESQDWPADLSMNEALGQLLTFSHAAPFPQLCVVAATAVGLLTYRRLDALRWIGPVAAVFGTLFIVAASSDAPWANGITSFWWNDRWRLVAPAAIALAVIAGHGLAEIQRRISSTLERAAPGRAVSRLALAGRAAVALLVLLGFVTVSDGDYIERNAARMSASFQAGPAVTPAEIVGLEVLASIAPPGGRVLNDRGDGTAWMYAITGLRPVAGHYNGGNMGPDTALLAGRFRDYRTDPAVRAAVDRWGIEYVVLSRSFLRPWAIREPGLDGLDGSSWLEQVYRNSDLTIYRITGTEPANRTATAE